MPREIAVNLEFTPNPNTLKFTTNVQLLERGAANFTDMSKTDSSPLARALFEIEGVSGILIAPHFVTVTKAPTGSWETLATAIPTVLEKHLGADLPVMADTWTFEQPETKSLSKVEALIIEILEKEIRPAVAMDGGDIEFERFDSGTVYLAMQGACKSCPSALATLKDGVEQRLKAAIPEVQSVVQV